MSHRPHVLKAIATFAAIAVGLAGTAELSAQSAHVLSVQGSLMVLNSTVPVSEGFYDYGGTKFGLEGQLRISPGWRLSIGAGYQLADLTAGEDPQLLDVLETRLKVMFIEPRYVVANARNASIYLAGRVGSGKVTCKPAIVCRESKAELAFGGGGGALLHLGGIALDVGAQYFRFSGASSPGFLFLRGGLSIGL